MIAGFECLHGARHQPVVEQRLLGKPLVETHAEFGQVVAAIAQLFGQRVIVDISVILAQQALGVGDQRVQMRVCIFFNGRGAMHHFGVCAHIARAMRRLDLLRHVAHIPALIDVCRKRQLRTVQFQIAQPGGQRKNIHLPPGIVHIVFARHPVASRIQHIRQACAVRRTAPVPDMQRTGRVGRNELHLHLAPRPQCAAPVSVASLQHRLDHRLLGGSGNEHIDKTGACDFDFLHHFGAG